MKSGIYRRFLVPAAGCGAGPAAGEAPWPAAGEASAEASSADFFHGRGRQSRAGWERNQGTGISLGGGISP
jgi:hypothetical protein